MKISRRGIRYFLALSIALFLLQACSDDLQQPLVTTSYDGPPPAIEILSPNANFVIGSALPLGQAEGPESVTVAGLLHLPQSANNTSPQVTINQLSVPVNLLGANVCQTPENAVCYGFSHDYALTKDKYQFDIQVIDGDGTRYSRQIGGVVDYCRIGEKDAGIQALIQDDVNYPQGNRCHEIDGCSVYVTPNDPSATSEVRNDPMAAFGNTKAVASTAFGAGTVPITEYFVHGQQPHDALPCNLHDVCYQSTASTRSDCDNQFHAALEAVCAAAYPGANPYPTGSTDYLTWAAQKEECLRLADTYYAGVAAAGAAVFDQHKLDYKP